MKLIVTRHGETGYNAQGRYAGSTDVPLSETGLLQADELAESLKGRRIDVLVSSPLARARQTAQRVGEAFHMPVIVREGFAERDMGVYEGLTRQEARERYPEVWARLGARLPDDGPPEGETIRQCVERVAAALEGLKAEYGDKTVLLVCHGMTARAINKCLTGLSYEDMHGFTLGNCELAEYEY